MYRFEVHCHADENGYAPIIGIVEVENPDYGDATELAKFLANRGDFDTRTNDYSESDVAYVTPSRF